MSLWSHFGPLWRRFGAVLGPAGRLLAPRGPAGVPQGARGALGTIPGGHLRTGLGSPTPFGSLFGSIWAPFRFVFSIQKWSVFGSPFGALLAPFWLHLGAFLAPKGRQKGFQNGDPFGEPFGVPKGGPGTPRHCKIVKIPQVFIAKSRSHTFGSGRSRGPKKDAKRAPKRYPNGPL